MDAWSRCRYYLRLRLICLAHHWLKRAMLWEEAPLTAHPVISCNMHRFMRHESPTTSTASPVWWSRAALESSSMEWVACQGSRRLAPSGIRVDEPQNFNGLTKPHLLGEYAASHSVCVAFALTRFCPSYRLTLVRERHACQFFHSVGHVSGGDLRIAALVWRKRCKKIENLLPRGGLNP